MRFSPRHSLRRKRSYCNNISNIPQSAAPKKKPSGAASSSAAPVVSQSAKPESAAPKKNAPNNAAVKRSEWTAHQLFQDPPYGGKKKENQEKEVVALSDLIAE